MSEDICAKCNEFDTYYGDLCRYCYERLQEDLARTDTSWMYEHEIEAQQEEEERLSLGEWIKGIWDMGIAAQRMLLHTKIGGSSGHRKEENEESDYTHEGETEHLPRLLREKQQDDFDAAADEADAMFSEEEEDEEEAKNPEDERE